MSTVAGLVAFFLFGLSSWITINGIWTQVAFLLANTPEGNRLPTWMALAIQIGNVLPVTLAFIQARRAAKGKGAATFEAVSIVLVILFGTVALWVGALFWKTTIVLSDGAVRVLQVDRLSVVLLAVVLVTGALDCSSSVLYWPFVLRFSPQSLVAFSAGEAASGSIASVVTIIQGDPKSPRFSFSAFLWILSGFMAVSLGAFIYILRPVTRGSLIALFRGRAGVRTDARGHVRVLSTDENAGVAVSPSPPPPSSAVSVGNGDPEAAVGRGEEEEGVEEEGQLHRRRGSEGKERALLDWRLLRALGAVEWPSLLGLAAINFVGNGYFPSITGYVFRAYDNSLDAVYWSSNISIFLGPLFTVANACCLPSRNRGGSSGSPETESAGPLGANEKSEKGENSGETDHARRRHRDGEDGDDAATNLDFPPGGARGGPFGESVNANREREREEEGGNAAACWQGRGRDFFSLVLWLLWLTTVAVQTASCVSWPEPLAGMKANGAWVMLAATLVAKALSSFLKTALWANLQATAQSLSHTVAVSSPPGSPSASHDHYRSFRAGVTVSPPASPTEVQAGVTSLVVGVGADRGAAVEGDGEASPLVGSECDDSLSAKDREREGDSERGGASRPRQTIQREGSSAGLLPLSPSPSRAGPGRAAGVGSNERALPGDVEGRGVSEESSKRRKREEEAARTVGLFGGLLTQGASFLGAVIGFCLSQYYIDPKQA
uniref:Uncharacterized protein n=1 Tax=Chromera velia CCMP2878 TaxID=1169474 RepID=A0A0G4IG50_9ALVE|mmetsp:Transcript_25484/g.49821  ORF Transcript_25484/g.49821 Transcript_25484/m.49821 type:complete len:721 (+) Transcript_25484:199-2361(+)|eukprot:Cvel_14168.t1-p1 / transcript=Cvel_14168.t1 / gene=Cvel_14168 / organism=Chromera_velia_CCMP2878 / gene_product=Solute carrier family 52, riboflavin transporter,, putative / transcript_product=Solute carrier family 52, riboflavin transporter,, putative / location=Cvel_scaffold998:32727-40229(-) / protein_length=720 / sequence_SO=supercontig / SO=protein_coding / is_pseudo=false